jgi:hypothetical protein
MTLNQAALSEDERHLSVRHFYGIIQLWHFCWLSETLPL